MEQEEMTALAKTAAADQGVDADGASTGVWLPSPENTAAAATAAVVPETNGQHQFHEMSLDGEYETPV